jgi:outer membrane protein OmpA-like peptidoglycan-associated protein
MNSRFIVPVIAVVSAGVVASFVGCGGADVDLKVATPVASVSVAPPPVPTPPPPPPDRDGDGIADAQDACPDAKGVANPDPKLNGCPPDRDGDGIADDQDACPDFKGIKSDDPKKNGCPPPPVPTGKIKFRGRQLRLPIELEFDIGKATIKQSKASLAVLDELNTFMGTNTQVTLLEVQGHTDNTGNEDGNVKLSTDRAQAVIDALAAKGVDKGRFSAKGFGSRVDFIDEKGKDIPNDTAPHRAMNRRVEFHMVGIAGKENAEVAATQDPSATPPAKGKK